MPDPLTNLEIQDVLSSIRRLVSEDNRHRAERERAREAGGGPPASVPAEAGKLVLTEALRVPLAEMADLEEAADAVPAATDLADPEPAHLTDPAGAEALSSDVPAEGAGGEVLDLAITGEGRFEAGSALPAVAESETTGDDTWEAADDVRDADAGSLEDTIAELEAAVAGIGGEFEPDGSEVAHGREIDAELEEAFEDGFAVDLAAGEEADALAQSVTSGAIGASSGTGHSGGAGVPAAAEPAAGDRVEDAESGQVPETIEEDEAAGVAAEAAGAEPESAAPVDHSDLGTPEVPEAPVDDVPEEAGPTFIRSAVPWRGTAPAATLETARPAGLRRLTLTAADAVPEAPARRDRGDAVPAEPEPATVPDDAPGLASALAGDSAGRAEGEGEAESSLFGPGDDGLVDMDMLRDLVAEIIREELQGPLGERITRNVRILVRREINRALESRGLELGRGASHRHRGKRKTRPWARSFGSPGRSRRRQVACQAASASSAAWRRSLSSRDSATEVRTPFPTNSISPFTTRSLGSIPAQDRTSRPSRERAQRAIWSGPLPYFLSSAIASSSAASTTAAKSFRDRWPCSWLNAVPSTKSRIS